MFYFYQNNKENIRQAHFETVLLMIADGEK